MFDEIKLNNYNLLLQKSVIVLLESLLIICNTVMETLLKAEHLMYYCICLNMLQAEIITKISR